MNLTLKTAAVSALGLLAVACTPTTPTPPAEDKPVADQPASADPAFVNALSFLCEGGGKVELVINQGQESSALVRVDGGASVKLPFDETATSGMTFKDATTSVTFDGGALTHVSGGVTKVCKFESRSLDAPLVPGVVRDLKQADAGASVTMKVGEKISVSLVGVPTAGYVWAASKPPAFVKASDGPGGATTTDQMLPGFAGGSHWEVVVIEAVSAGEGEITLAQRRPWEPESEPDAETFKFKLKVE